MAPNTSDTRIKWTLEKDNRLLQAGLCREVGKNLNVGRADFQIIADSFEEKPTVKAVEERYAKLRKKQLALLEELGLYSAETEEEVREVEMEGEEKKREDVVEEK
ncbi:hypothetical protein LTR62_004833 [Meristemomyces frigidus]|uniref:Uncharacterized protein n=1 Tax=Meristemomyces frigidus TaxID=1508187 RepID=A0AAN7TES8_9PEZI|nr:hypothetical protein LTR62_004833 [Meristemomyces frigidus]